MIKTALLASAISLTVITTAFSSASAEQVTSVTSESRSLTVAKDKSVAFRLDATVGELVVAAPDIAEIVAKTDHSFYIRGKKAGATNVLVYGPNQQLIEVIDVRVGPDAASLRQDLAIAAPGDNIQVANYGDGVMLSGQVATQAAANRVKAIAARYAGEAVASTLTVRDSQQVVLEVRVVEASRTAMRDLGVDLSAIGVNGSLVTGVGLLGVTPPAAVLQGRVGSFNGVGIDATLSALEDRGVLKTLAKPNLVAMSGEEASFLAGGEFPFPVPQGRDQITIEFKPFGVKLKFTPTVQENGEIRLKVEPEVSALDRQQSVRINGIDVPSLTVRRAATTVSMDPGKSLAIAGLFQQDDVKAIRQTPGLGSVPILGALFRSERFNSYETELVIIVTPRLADTSAPIHDPWSNADAPAGRAPAARPTTASAPAAPQAPAAATPTPPAPVAAAQTIAAPLALPAPVVTVAPEAPAPVAIVAPAPQPVVAAPAPVQPVAAEPQPAPAAPTQVAAIAIPAMPTPPRPPAPPPLFLTGGRPVETVLTTVSTPREVEDPYKFLNQGS